VVEHLAGEGPLVRRAKLAARRQPALIPKRNSDRMWIHPLRLPLQVGQCQHLV
jgi:hypothetical protein